MLATDFIQHRASRTRCADPAFAAVTVFTVAALVGLLVPMSAAAQIIAPGKVAEAIAARAASAASGGATARIPALVGDADIERARREARLPSEKDVEDVRRKHGAGSDTRGQHLVPAPSRPPSPTPPPSSLRSFTSSDTLIDSLPKPLTSTPIDLEAVARTYAAQNEGPTASRASTGPGLLVFVSLSMPRPALVQLLQQAARARATVVLRGLANGSLRETVAIVGPLADGKQAALQIDPQAFDRFAITRVPSFVLVRDGARPQSCASGTCAPPGDFLLVAGDVSLDYALAYMQRVQPSFRADAASFVKRLSNGMADVPRPVGSGRGK